MSITQKVNCKINLGLQILRKRDDGYHEIHTIFYPTDFFTDTLTLESSDQELEFVCQSAEDIGPSENNLCVKAFRLLQADYGIKGVKITLEKSIPSGAGLGGGSADAAFTLKMLSEFFNLELSNGQLKAYAAQLGSDVPFFIDNVPMYATGRGEVLEPIDLDLSDYNIYIVKPNFSASTREAYAGVTPKVPETDVIDIIRQPVTEWVLSLHNDFEDSLFSKFPELTMLKSRLYAKGATYASMTGSGTAVFGLFKKL